MHNILDLEYNLFHMGKIKVFLLDDWSSSLSKREEVSEMRVVSLGNVLRKLILSPPFPLGYIPFSFLTFIPFYDPACATYMLSHVLVRRSAVVRSCVTSGFYSFSHFLGRERATSRKRNTSTCVLEWVHSHSLQLCSARDPSRLSKCFGHPWARFTKLRRFGKLTFRFFFNEF